MFDQILIQTKIPNKIIYENNVGNVLYYKNKIYILLFYFIFYFLFYAISFTVIHKIKNLVGFSFCTPLKKNIKLINKYLNKHKRLKNKLA